MSLNRQLVEILVGEAANLRALAKPAHGSNP